MTAIASVRLNRDRATWLIYLQLGVFATYLYGLSAVLPLLRIDQGVSQTTAGLHGTAMAAGGIATGLALPWLTGRIGRRAVVWTGLAGMNAGMLLVAASTALPATLLGYGMASGMASITLYAGMAALADHHGPAGPAAISEANAVCVIVGIGVPFVVSAAAQSAFGWRAALLVPLLLTVLLALTMGRVWMPERDGGAGGPADDADAPGAGVGAGDAGAGDAGADGGADGGVNGTGGGSGAGGTSGAGAGGTGGAGAGPRFGWRFYLAGMVLFCCVAMEFCFNLWAARLFSDQTGLSAAVAATALTAFTAGMAAGRLAGGRLALRVPPAALLVGALLLTAAGWAVFWPSTHPALSYAGLALCGLGVSLHFPLALSRVLAVSAGQPDHASAVASIYASLAVGAGPFLLGALADGFGTQQAFLMVPALVGLAVGGVLVNSSRRT
ncbi:putative MFS family arabinose efflux permease [Streptosporangium becharense]|uniref:Putative MFS family arabinose efflux permease n=1 Tax=Streptosporangium becharense TaxID=1816182 RepID=A0A7W9IHK2_9ACTN|nr:MFS transporter [Streptosporangium becharense]MBB2914762.1 putative MFS family arabinose efflux permease [Streptosporangium becharense]MBB5820837.1 putative MFS family arabinose efflux permease [Streptosporangium becharense]